MNAAGTLMATLVLTGVHITVGKWHWLHRNEHSPWLSVSAGTALAYVFVYMLPKLALTQLKLTAILSSFWTPVLRNQTYLIALAGLVCFFYLGWADNKIERSGASESIRTRRAMLLHIGGYGVYSLQIGVLIARLPRPDFLSLLLATTVLGLHLMGVDHAVRKSDPENYDKLLRWAFAVALLLGWAIGTFTSRFDTEFMLWSAFISGGIIITAIGEELPSGARTRFWPFVAGVIGSSAAILIIQGFQNAVTG